MYGEDFYELMGKHRDGCPIGTILVDAKVTEEEKKCPVCGCELKLGSYREIVDVDKANDEIDRLESDLDEARSDLSDVRENLEETGTRLEDRDAEIENLQSIISDKDDYISSLESELAAWEGKE